MKLVYRKAELADMISCFDIFKHYYSDPKQHGFLPSVWKNWVSDGAMLGCIVEDIDQPPEQRIVAHGMVVFLSDEFADDLLANPHPYIAERLVRESLEGKSPVLNANEVARANAGDGLNFLNIHSGVRDYISESPLYSPVIDQLLNSYFWRFTGFRLRQILQETVNIHMFRWVVSGGYRLRSHYEKYYAGNSETAPSLEFRRALVGVTREEALADPGARVLTLYTSSRPKLGLTLPHQELLELAVSEEDDESLALRLHISLSAVKKRWLAIYEDVRAVDPAILGETENTDTGSDSRGREKRRHLLWYLRQHPEELKPYAKD